ncbi:MAG: hypothetical protein ACI4A3_12285 [Lachnospiraceae bacterium]
MIRPIEMQMLLPRTEAVGTEKQYENQKVMNENTYAANEVAKEAKHNSETVIKKDPNEFAEYKYDAKEEGNGTYQNPRKQKRKKKDEDGITDADNNNEINKENGQPRINIQI